MKLLVTVKQFLSKFVVLLEFCKDCGRKQPIVWHADDALWNRVAQGENVLCPMCFDRRAAKRGIYIEWTPTIGWIN